MRDFPETQAQQVRGRKGGGKGGGGSSGTPYEAPDNLLADSTAYIIDVVSEGEIEGWARPNHPATCIFFDDTPLQNPDGSYNFPGVEFHLRTGTPDQEPVPGFSAVESEVAVSAEVKASLPIVRTITADDVDAVRVKVGVNQLTTLNKDTGDLTGAAVDFSIDLQVGAGPWYTHSDLRISGKTTSGYQRAYRVDLPNTRPVSIRVRRRTPDQTTSNISDDLYFVSYTEIIDAKLRYPDTAYVALAVPAQAFGGRIPRRSYRLKGMKCWVPSNYDPVARTYDETTIWDGTFKLAFTSNPAFFTYTVFIEDRWGLGERIDPTLVDKWRIYQIGKYCDEAVPNGLGGVEPRFTMNGVMNTREAAYQVVTQLSAAFRGVTYWGAGAIVPVQDAPSDPIKLVTNANVVDGQFSYSGTALSSRKTAGVASFRDPFDHYRIKPRAVYEDHAAIQRYGRRPSDISLPFTTVGGEALRALKWLVDTDTTQRETVTYQAGFDHAGLRPGDRILVSDRHRVGFRMGGRLLGIAGDRMSVDLDAPVTLQASETYTLLLADDVGDFVTAPLVAGQSGDLSTVNLSAALPANVLPGAVFMMTASNLAARQFRVLSNTPDGHLFNIIALEDDPNKYARVEQGIRVDSASPYILPNAQQPKQVQNLQVRVYYRAAPAGLVASISWQVLPGENVSAFQVEFTDNYGVRTQFPEQRVQSIDIPLEGAEIGSYSVHVRAKNVLNIWSEFANVQFSVDQSVLYPDDVTGFDIRVLGNQATLSWDQGAPIVQGYRIRYSADPSGGWDTAIDVQANVSGNTSGVPPLAGAYLIKAISVFGFESLNASVVTSNTLNLAHFNVVEAVAAEPGFAGTLSNGLVRGPDEIILLGATSMFDGNSMFSGRSMFSGSSVEPEGIYELAGFLDLSEVYTSRLSADVRAFAFKTTDSMFSGNSMFTGASIWGNIGSSWGVRVEVSVTDDDPASPSAVWSVWQPLMVGDYSARGFKFRVRLLSDDPVVGVVLEGLTVTVDMPDRIARGDDIQCPATGVTVTFNPPFKATPTILVNGQGLPAGARSERTNVSRSGFTQRFYDDSDTPIAASFDYGAVGYGREA